jgi:hypothetical protein
MRKILESVLGAVLIACAPVAALAQVQPTAVAQLDDPAKLTEAQAIVGVIFPPQNRQEMIRGLLNQFNSQFAGAVPSAFESLHDAGLNAIIDKFRASVPDAVAPVAEAHLPQILDAMAIAYTHEFSLTELKDIHAFAQTPAGAHYLSHSTQLMGDPAIAAANKAYIADVVTVGQSKQAQLKSDVLAYLKAHPDVQKKVEALDAANK